jgi:hypothetical protein
MTAPVVGDGRHVFLARSSLHFLLATAMAEDLRASGGAPSSLLFLPDVLDPSLFERAVARWPEPPFDRIVFLAPQRLPGDAGARRGSGAVRADLRRELAAARPLSVTVFNDREEAGQTLLVEAARRFPEALRRCAEDGSRAYTGFAQSGHSLFGRWRQRVRVGSGWADVRVLGTHPLVQEFVALHPHLLRPELRGPKLRPLPSHALSGPAVGALAAALCSVVGFDPASLVREGALLLLNHSNYAKRNPDYAARVQACASALHAAHTLLYVKHHPRESQADPLGLIARGHAEVPRTLPAESLYLSWRERPMQVIGGMSTSLMTAALLMPRARVRVLQHASASGDAWNPALLEALRIEPLPSTGLLDAEGHLVD